MPKPLKAALVVASFLAVCNLGAYIWTLYPKARHTEAVQTAVAAGRELYARHQDQAEKAENGWAILEDRGFLQTENLYRWLERNQGIEEAEKADQEHPEVYRTTREAVWSDMAQLKDLLEAPVFAVQLHDLRADLQRVELEGFLRLHQAIETLTRSFSRDGVYESSLQALQVGFEMADRMLEQPVLLTTMVGAKLRIRQSRLALEFLSVLEIMSESQRSRLLEICQRKALQPREQLRTCLQMELAGVDALKYSVEHHDQPDMSGYAGTRIYFDLPGVLEREFRIYENAMGDTLVALERDFAEIPRVYTDSDPSFVKGEIGILSAVLVPQTPRAWESLQVTGTVTAFTHLALKIKVDQIRQGGVLPAKVEGLPTGYTYRKTAQDRAVLSCAWPVELRHEVGLSIRGVPGLSVDRESLKLEFQAARPAAPRGG